MTGKPRSSGPPTAIQDPRSLPCTPGRRGGSLPHLVKPPGTHFVTFCLQAAGAGIPLGARTARLSTTDPHEVARLSEPAGPPALPLLALPRAARVVEQSLLRYQGERYGLHAWCVMPDHVHALVTPFARQALERILHSWKSFTAHEINRMLHRSGGLWRRESFDHLVRSGEAFGGFLRYIEANPVAGGLCEDPADWPFSSARHRKALSL